MKPKVHEYHHRKTNFENKVVWITGASSGIGEALAYSLSTQGANLILSSRNMEALKQVKENCTGSSSVSILQLDISEVDKMEKAAQQAVNIFGRVDYMVHNAGIAQKGLVADTGMDVDYKIMETNYFGTVALTKALLPYMVKQESGRFVVISSLAGCVGVPTRSAYSASKHALHGFFDSLRSEVHKDKVGVTLVCPGFVKTNITINALIGDGSQYGVMEKSHEMGITAEECAERIVSALLKNKDEVLIGRTEIWGIYIKRLFPRVFSRIIRNHPIRRWRNITRSVKRVIIPLMGGLQQLQ